MNRQLISQMIAYAPQFEPLAALSMSRLVELRNDDATYGQAIGQLKRTIAATLEGGRIDRISDALDLFEADYPTVVGVDAYRTDLARYERMLASYVENDLFEIARIDRAGRFETQPFRTVVDKWIDEILPSPALIATYEQSAELWRAGDAPRAIATLLELDSAKQDDHVQAKIERYQSIDAAYQTWRADPSLERLLALRELLNPSEDSFYLNQTEEAFASQRHVVEEELSSSLDNARQHWQAYHNDGGIPGLLRLEDRVSQQFTKQAELLSAAYREIKRGERHHVLLQINRSSELISLEAEIHNEIKRQRLWLDELRLVMNADALNRKLALLPTVEE